MWPTTSPHRRNLALPIPAAGIIGGTAVGLAGMANAATPSYNPEPRPGIVAVPQTKAEPAAEAHPARGRTGIIRR